MSTAQQQAEALAAGLYAHQVEGIAFLLGRQRAILADDMGLGKTRQSVLAMRQARPEGTIPSRLPGRGQNQLGARDWTGAADGRDRHRRPRTRA